jgi:fumarate reductase iron-sulfur subunit
MKIDICNQSYTVEQNVDTILNALFLIKKTQNRSLAFRSGCKSGVCGSCAVRVNGVERLACKTTVSENDVVEPLKNSEVIKDLVVDSSNQEKFIKLSKASLQTLSNASITTKDEKIIDVESNCILCSSCYSSCPVYEVNKEFLGPFALTRVARYVNDKKESNINDKIEAIQTNGVWDCTLCGSCDMVCPSGINIKNNIMQLQNKSVMLGYNNPKLQNFDDGFNTGFDTSFDFGFNPNGF